MFPRTQLIICSQNISSGTRIPQRPYGQGSAILDGTTRKMIKFATTDGKCFPAALALAGHCDHLADGGAMVLTEKNQTINLRIEVFVLHVILDLSLIPFLHIQWPGYDAWGAQVGIMSPG